MKSKEIPSNFHRSKDPKKTQWMDALWYPWLDPGTGNDMMGKLVKSE